MSVWDDDEFALHWDKVKPWIAPPEAIDRIGAPRNSKREPRPDWVEPVAAFVAVFAVGAIVAAVCTAIH